MPNHSGEEKDLLLTQFTIEQAADAIFWHDPKARIQRVNKAACKLLGYSREELLRLTIQDINPNSTSQTWARFWEQLKASKVLTFEDQHQTKDGRLIPLEIISHYIKFEGQEFLVGFARDISERKRIETEKACAFEEIHRLRKQLELENEYLIEEVSQLQSYGDIVGQSPALLTILKQIDMVAPTDANILIGGESGTGKELIAHEIHSRSERSHRPMIRVNCASIPRELYESEFFGHVKGAFTGAVKDRAGRFELAHNGTLFLDEVGEIPLELQSKLLRVLQEGTYERVGDEKTRKADVRIVAATNRDLKEEVEQGRFREDLFYRLNVFPIEVPPLRKRRDDIPLLAHQFLTLAAKKFHTSQPRLSKANVQHLQNYEWPGNVRELQNVLERAVITSEKGTLHLDLPTGKGRGKNISLPRDPSLQNNGEIFTDAQMKHREQENILSALDQTRWKIFGPGGAAELLAMRPTTLISRIKKMGLQKPG
jgi:formate hydrogenlyase transcriptional activator